MVALVEGAAKQGHTSFIISRRMSMLKVREFCESKENCRRQQMLRYIGSERVDSASVTNSLCCDMCSGVDSIPANLKFESFTASAPVPSKTQPQKRRVFKLSKELTEQLKTC